MNLSEHIDDVLYPLHIDIVALVNRWTAAFATCAIEGNEYAQRMLELKETDMGAFVREVLRLEREKGDDREES